MRLRVRESIWFPAGRRPRIASGRRQYRRPEWPRDQPPAAVPAGGRKLRTQRSDMRLPNQAQPVPRLVSGAAVSLRGIRTSHCSLGDKIKCGAEGAALIVGPCDPAGMPEDLPICLPAAATYLGTCGKCLGDTVKDVICKAVHLAEQAHIPIPAPLKALCP